jgi:hypothetical protein
VRIYSYKVFSPWSLQGTALELDEVGEVDGDMIDVV